MKRQLGADGAKDAVIPFSYKAQLLNMSSLMGVTAFLSKLKHNTGDDFLAYSMDRHGPQSEYSLHWQLEFTTAT